MGAALSTGGLGGMPPGGGGGALPEDQLLQQIRDLLDQYLAQGQDTPVAPQAQALADAIDGAAGGGAPPGYGGDQGMPPGAPPGGPGLGDMGPPPDMGQGPEAGPSMEPGPGEPPRDTSHKTFASANKSARARLEQRNKPKRPKPDRNK